MFRYKSFLEAQVQAKAKQRELEKQNNKWFIDKEIEDVSKYIADEKVKQQQHMEKEKETKFFIESQIQHKRNVSQREKIGKYGSRGMNQDEYNHINNHYDWSKPLYLFNRKLLFDINQKKKDMIDEFNKQQNLVHKTQDNSLFI